MPEDPRQRIRTSSGNGVEKFPYCANRQKAAVDSDHRDPQGKRAYDADDSDAGSLP